MKISVKDAADLLDMPQQLLRLSLQEGCFPFGVAVKRKRWSYYINRARLVAWLEGKDEV